jgi:hypothetical protein
MAVERRPDGTTRGGNEPPDEIQDTPEQNAGYDAAVRNQFTDEPVDETPDPRAAETDPHDRDRGKTTLSDLPQGRPGRRRAGR